MGAGRLSDSLTLMMMIILIVVIFPTPYYSYPVYNLSFTKGSCFLNWSLGRKVDTRLLNIVIIQYARF
jgi:hypothetical protein